MAATFNVKWNELLNEAISNPGQSSNIYNRFHNYSFQNRILFMVQGLNEPVAGYNKWSELGRQVRKGEKAAFLWMPKIRKDKNTGDSKCYGFFMAKKVFGLSQTDGPEIEFPENNIWDREKCLEELNIKIIPFAETNGNIQGYASNEGIAINPVAKYPLKTLLHEIAHKVMNHKESNSITEFQAETVAYILMYEIGASDKFDASASRAYIQNWLKNNSPSESNIQEVFRAVDKILKAGV